MAVLKCELGLDVSSSTMDKQQPLPDAVESVTEEPAVPPLPPPTGFRDTDPGENHHPLCREHMPYRPALSMRRPPAAIRNPVVGPPPGLLPGGSKFWTVCSSLLEPPDFGQALERKVLAEPAAYSRVLG
jgi:hypothetical protein